MARKEPKPLTERKAKEIVRLDRINQQIEPKSVVAMRLNRIFEAGMRNEESLWFARGKARHVLRQNMKNYPEEFRAKRHSFAMMMNKALPTKLEHTVVTESKGVTPDQLEKAGLTMEQIRELAFGSEQAQIGESDGTE